jgi:hypothetical protein
VLLVIKYSAPKIPGQFEFGKVLVSLKLKNTQNRVFLSCRVITKIRGIDEKSP